MKVELTKSFFFEAAHSNPNGNEKQRRLHGHSYEITLVTEGEVLSEMGWLIDYGEMSEAFGPIYEQLDHHVLNDIEDMDAPALETVRKWTMDKLRLVLPQLKDVRLSIVGDCRFMAIPMPARPHLRLPATYRFTFEAAQYLAQLPPEHKCRNMHGHSYRVEIGTQQTSPIVLTEAMRGLYDELDHKCLNEIPGLENATCEVICGWLWDRLKQTIDGLDVIVVQETGTARCIYHGE